MRQVIITIVVLFGSPVWALTYMGPPASDVKQGELFLGFDYSHGEVDFEFRDDGVRGILDGVDIGGDIVSYRGARLAAVIKI